MYFPEDMTFQYFFFDTYIGYFLQALPIALIVCTIYGIVRFRKDKETSISLYNPGTSEINMTKLNDYLVPVYVPLSEGRIRKPS